MTTRRTVGLFAALVLAVACVVIATATGRTPDRPAAAPPTEQAHADAGTPVARVRTSLDDVPGAQSGARGGAPGVAAPAHAATEPVVMPRPGDAASAAGTATGQIFLPDLTPDLAVSIDGTVRAWRRHDVAPGVHTVALGTALHWDELARVDVHVDAGSTTVVPLSAFELEHVCTARAPDEELAPEHADSEPATWQWEPVLTWLARHQRADGLWSAVGFDRCCVGARCDGAGGVVGDVETTALVVLAFAIVGDTRFGRADERSLDAALRALCALQGDDGRFAARREHALVTLALTEFAAGSARAACRSAAARGIAAILACEPSADAETAALEALALAAARRTAGDDAALDGRLAQAERELRLLGAPLAFPPRQRALLAAARALVTAQPDADDELRAAVASLTKHVAAACAKDRFRGVDPLTVYATSLAAHAIRGTTWDAWKVQVEHGVADTQEKTGRDLGFWTSAHDDLHACRRDRITTTALHLLSLQIYYRYERVLGRAE